MLQVSTEQWNTSLVLRYSAKPIREKNQKQKDPISAGPKSHFLSQVINPQPLTLKANKIVLPSSPSQVFHTQFKTLKLIEKQVFHSNSNWTRNTSVWSPQLESQSLISPLFLGTNFVKQETKIGHLQYQPGVIKTGNSKLQVLPHFRLLLVNS